MKHKNKIMAVFLFSILTHYFVLTFFKVDAIDSFVGVVNKIEISDKGLYANAKVDFLVEEDLNGEKKLVNKTIMLLKRDIKKFRMGKKYSVKSHQHWLLALK